MYPSEPGAPQPAPDSTGSPPKQYGCREELCPALSDPDYVRSGQRARVSGERPILRPARLHTGRPGRSSVYSGPRGRVQPGPQTPPRSTSSSSYSSPNSSSSGEITNKTLLNKTENGKRNNKHRQMGKHIPKNTEYNPTEVPDNIVTDETSNVNNNPLTPQHNNEVANEVAEDAEDYAASVVITDEVEMSLVCKCHPCGNFCDLNEYKSTHLNECVPPVVKFVKVTCICGRTFRVAKHLFIANDLCRHNFQLQTSLCAQNNTVKKMVDYYNLMFRTYSATDLNNDRIIQEDDDVNSTIEIFNGLNINDNEYQSQHVNSTAVNSNINEEDDNLATDNMNLSTRNVDLLTETAAQDGAVSLISGEEEVNTTITNLCSKPMVETVGSINTFNVNGISTNVSELNEEVIRTIANLCTEPEIETVESINTFNVNGTSTNVSELNNDELKNQDALSNYTAEEIIVELNDEESSEEERTYLMSPEGCEDEAHCHSNSDEDPEDDEFDDGISENEDAREDDDDRELHDSGSSEMTEHYYWNAYKLVVASLKEKFRNNVVLTPQDDDFNDGDTDHENESLHLNEHHQSNSNVANLNETFENNDEMIPQDDESVDSNIGNENGRQHNDNAGPHDEAKNHALVSNESSQITEHHQSNSGVANLNKTFENNDEIITQDDESVDNNIDNENRRQDSDNVEPHDEAKDLASVNNESSQSTENNKTNGNAANLDETLRNDDAVAPHIDGFDDRNINDENEDQDDEIQNAEFNEMCVMYRFDFLNLRWISRGPGQFLILYDLENNRWLLQFRRLVTPGEFRVTRIMPIHPGLRLQQMKYNDRAWEWTYHYLRPDGTGEFENVAVRFREEETAKAFHEKFNKVKLMVIHTDRHARRYRFATSCPTWPPPREISTPSDVTSICGAVSPTFNASSPTFDVLPPTDGAISPTDGAISPTDGMSTFGATEHIAVQTDSNDGALAGVPGRHFDINMPSTSETSQTLRTVSNNEEIVHELKEIKDKQNETLVEVKKMSSFIQSYGKNSGENRAIVTAKAKKNKNALDKSDNYEGVHKDKAQEKKNDENCSASNETKENNHISAVSNGGTCGFDGVLEPHSKISSESNQINNRNSPNDAKTQANKDPGVSKGKENQKKFLGKKKSTKTNVPINKEPSEQLNWPLAVTELSYPADGEMDSDNSNPTTSNVTKNNIPIIKDKVHRNNENKDESREDKSNDTQETPNSAANETNVMPKPSTSEILSQADILTQSNTAKSMKNDESCIENDANKDIDQQQSLQTAEITDDTKNKSQEKGKENTMTTTVIAPEVKIPAKTATTTNNDTNKEDQRDDADRNKGLEASYASVKPETSSSHAAKEKGPELAKDNEDNSLTEEKSKNTEEDNAVTTVKTNMTKKGEGKANTNEMNLRPLQIIIKIMRVCCRIVFYMFGLSIVTMVTILLIYFFEELTFTFECQESENN